MFAYIFFGVWFILPFVLLAIVNYLDVYDTEPYELLALFGLTSFVFGLFLYNVIPDCSIFAAFVGGNAVTILISLLNNR